MFLGDGRAKACSWLGSCLIPDRMEGGGGFSHPLLIGLLKPQLWDVEKLRHGVRVSMDIPG